MLVKTKKKLSTKLTSEITFSSYAHMKIWNLTRVTGRLLYFTRLIHYWVKVSKRWQWKISSAIYSVHAEQYFQRFNWKWVWVHRDYSNGFLVEYKFFRKIHEIYCINNLHYFHYIIYGSYKRWHSWRCCVNLDI